MLESPPTASAALTALPALPADAYASVRRRMMLEYCKWDAQVGDIATLAPFALVLEADHWRRLAAWTEALAAETLAAEDELRRRPELHKRLAVPWTIRRLLRSEIGPATPEPRIMRFDFHLTTEGWRISEVNSDVPGGFTEATNLPALMVEQYGEVTTAGRPADEWADALTQTARDALTRRGRAEAVALHDKRQDSGAPRVALLSATGYMEDAQIVAYLGRLLRGRECEVRLSAPQSLHWRDGIASLGDDPRPIDLIVPFFQTEWLPGLPRRCGWRHFFHGARTSVVNPGASVLTESKRFPLVWDVLRCNLPTWRRLLPETRDPREAPWRRGNDWLLKAAYCNNGDEVAAPSLLSPKAWLSAERSARWFPGRWVAQRRFEPVAIDTPLGPVFPCLGVYAINGRACGIYGRMSMKRVIDFEAVDVAVLVRQVKTCAGAQAPHKEALTLRGGWR